MNRIFHSLITAISLFFIAIMWISCSGSTMNPLSPSSIQNPSISSNIPNNSQTHLWGLYEIHVNPDDKTVESVVDRTAMFTANVVNFINKKPGSLGFKINQIKNGAGYTDIDIDISITHPFPGMPQYNGYDVRGIFMGDGSATMLYNTDLRYPVNGIDQMMLVDPIDGHGGPDGFSRWYNYSEFSSGGMPLFNYTQGNAASPGFSGNATLNPYKYFANSLGVNEDLWTWMTTHPNSHGEFTTGAVNTRNYYLRFPSSKGIVYGYAVIANWKGVQQSDHPSNAPEAVSVKVIDTSDVYYVDDSTKGGNLIFDISVWDWDALVSPSGAMDNYRLFVDSTVLLSPYAFNTSEMTPVSGNENYSTFHVEIPADNITSADNQEYWIIAEQTGKDYTNDFGVPNLADTDPLASFFRFPLEIDTTIEPQEFGWAKTWGAGNQDRGYSVVVDNNGFIYVGGNYYYNCDFNPDPVETDYRNSNGNRDSFISKFDPEGKFLWVRTWDDNASFGGGVMALTCDEQNNVYAAGYFFGTNVDFDPGPGEDYHSYHGGGGDPYVTVFDSDGNFKWARSWGSDEDSLASSAMCVYIDSNNNVYVCGNWWGSGDFDPGPGEKILSTPSEGWDAYITKFDSTGTFQWAHLIGSTSYDFAYGIIADKNDDVYITGRFNNVVDFDPGAGVNSHNATTEGNNYIIKFDSAGNHKWGYAFGRGDTFRLAVDSSNNVYVRGSFWGTAQFDPVGGTKLLTALGLQDDYFNVFAPNGSWVKTVTWGSIPVGGDTSSFVGSAIWIDSSDNIYAAGCLSGTVDVDPGPGEMLKTSNGHIDAYVSKFDPSGNLTWCNTFGSTSVDQVTMVSVDDTTGSVYATGWFFDSCDFDPGVTEDVHTSNGSLDAFLIKYLTDGSW